jgi:collagen type III alpha
MDGRDGTLEQLAIQQVDERTIQFAFKNGDPIDGGRLRVPYVLDRGVYKAGTAYEKGDAVTWAGHYWIAKADTTEKPGDGATSWRMAVRRGSDGKTGPVGPMGPQGLRGEKGIDGRNWSGG